MIEALLINYIKNNVTISVKILFAILGLKSRSKEVWNKFEEKIQLLTWLAVKCRPELVTKIENIINVQQIKIEP